MVDTAKVEMPDGTTKHVPVTVTRRFELDLLRADTGAYLDPLRMSQPDWDTLLPDYDVHAIVGGGYVATRRQRYSDGI